jgi:glycosyltransferase 2 family protein
VNALWKATAGVAISTLLLWWALRGVALGEVWATLGTADELLLLAAVSVGSSGFLVRAMRWQVLLYPLRSGTGLGNRFAAVAIGFSANNILPARVGEFVRAWVISRLERIPATGALGSLVAERALDLTAVFALMGAAVLHPSFPMDATIGGRSVSIFATALLGLVGAILVTLALLLVFPRPILATIMFGARILPRRIGRVFTDGFTSFVSGLASLRDPRLLGLGLAWSFGFWILNAFSFWIAMRAVGIDLGFAPTLFVQGIIVLGVAVPAAPGFFGTFHAAAVVGLVEVYGAAQSATLAFAFGYHLGMFVPITLIGLWYAGRLGLSFQEMDDARREIGGRSLTTVATAPPPSGGGQQPPGRPQG